jgi:hypothetical protein
MLGGDSTKSVLAQVKAQVCPGLSFRVYITASQYSSYPGDSQKGSQKSHHIMGTLGPPEHRPGSPIQQCYAVTMVTAKGYLPGLSLHDTRHSWRWGSVMAIVFQTGVKVRDGHSEPGFERRADLGETNVRPKAESEASRPYHGPLGCVGLQLLPPCVLNTCCPFSASCTAQDPDSWPMEKWDGFWPQHLGMVSTSLGAGLHFLVATSLVALACVVWGGGETFSHMLDSSKSHCLGLELVLTLLTLSLLWVPVPSHCLSSQVTCPYVGCGESFADHSSIHAQVGVVAGKLRA